MGLFRRGVWSPVLVCGFDTEGLVARFTADGLDAWGCNPAVTPPWEAPTPHGPWRTVVLVDTLDRYREPINFLRHLPGEQLLLLAPADRAMVRDGGWVKRAGLYERQADG